MEEETGEFWKNKGNDLYRAKDYKAAADAYGKAIGIDPTNASLYTNRAAAYLMATMLPQALSDCEKAISIDPTNSKAVFRKASCLKAMGRLDPAIAALMEGLTLDPSSTVGMSDLETLNKAKLEIAQLKRCVQDKSFSLTLSRVEALIKSIGSAFKELNIIKAECLLGLGRSAEAYNMSNQMVGGLTALLHGCGL
jgi:tetratricopeptide (TPR) repeat protein